MAIFPEGPTGLYRSWRTLSTHLCLQKSAQAKVALHNEFRSQTHADDIFDEIILKISSRGEIWTQSILTQAHCSTTTPSAPTVDEPL